MSCNELGLLRQLAQGIRPDDLQLYYQCAIIGRRDLHLAPDPRAGFEMTLLRMLGFRFAGAGLAAGSPGGAPGGPGRGYARQPPRGAGGSSPALCPRPGLLRRCSNGDGRGLDRHGGGDGIKRPGALPGA